MKLQGRQHCHLVAKAVEKPRANRQAGASRSYVKKKKKKAGQKLLGLPFISSSPRRPGNVLLLPHSCIEEQCIPCQHIHCSSQHQAERAWAAIKHITYALALVAMCCFSSRCSPSATGGEGRSKTVPLPEFSILLLLPQQNLLLRAQQLPLVRAKGKT